MSMHDIRLTLVFSAKSGEWSIYADNGNYCYVRSLDELGEEVRKFLLSDARETATMLQKPGDEI